MLRNVISSGVAERADTSVDAVAVSNRINMQRHEESINLSVHGLIAWLQGGKSCKV
jgi:hypothetical protein